jgi:glycosyltransferase involved in cell wall biosynthesis
MASLNTSGAAPTCAVYSGQEIARANAKLFACFGLHSSGSTWMFNLIRDVCRAKAVDFVSVHRDSFKNLPRDETGRTLVIAKTHAPWDDYITHILEYREPAVITIRDPRDAIVSLMRRFPETSAFETALKDVATAANRLVNVAKALNPPIFRYEDNFIGRHETFATVSKLLSFEFAANERDTILLGLDADAVRHKIEKLAETAKIKGETEWDKETHWHANHVGDGQVGKYRKALTFEQQRQIVERTENFFEFFGYEPQIRPPSPKPSANRILNTSSAKAEFDEFLSESNMPMHTVTEQRSEILLPTLVVSKSKPPTQPSAGNKRQKICLSMIVKDEASVIRRCLESMRPIIDYWVIVDTGSTDGTQDVIRDVFADLPGELHERPWVDFAHNRSEALRLAREHGDYTFIIDADDTLDLPPGFRMPVLKADTYIFEIRHMNRQYWRAQMVSNRLPWCYEGVLHEFLSAGKDANNQRILPETLPQRRLPGVKIHMSEQGARRSSVAATRYANDAAVLEAAVSTETDPFLLSRYHFYLAQSHREAGNFGQALAAYRERIKYGGWKEELFLSYSYAATMMWELGFDEDEVIETFLEAHKTCPTRAEALHGAARFCRIKDRFRQGFDLAKRALPIKLPVDGLFLETWIYEYGVLDEYAVNAYWIAEYAECLSACKKLLALPSLPPDYRDRVAANAKFARGKLET